MLNHSLFAEFTKKKKKVFFQNCSKAISLKLDLTIYPLDEYNIGSDWSTNKSVFRLKFKQAHRAQLFPLY